jgi:hypothetical protein
MGICGISEVKCFCLIQPGQVCVVPSVAKLSHQHFLHILCALYSCLFKHNNGTNDFLSVVLLLHIQHSGFIRIEPFILPVLILWRTAV